MEKGSLFIVEDNVAEEKRLRLILKRLEYKVVGSSVSGKDAIRQVKKLQPDLILMDIFIEGDIDGIETANRISQSLRIPVLYLTSAENDDFLTRAKNTDPFGYVLKPVSEKNLQISIEMALYKAEQERKLITAKTYVNNVLNSSLNMIIAVDNERHITEFNRSAESTFGYGRNEVMGNHVNMLYADIEQGLDVHNTTIKNGHSVREILNQHKNGTTFNSLLVSSVLKNEKNEKIGVMGISQDISELRKTQRQLYETQQYAKNIIESSMDIIIAVDQNRQIMEFNPAAEESFGYSKQEIIGTPIDQLYYSSKKGVETHEHTLKKGKHITIVENKRKSGERFTCYLSASKILNKNGDYIGVMGISRDITEKLEAEKKLKISEKRHRKLSRELQESDNLKALLLDIITHDLKNPIGVISGMSEMMAEECPDSEEVELIKSSSDTLIQLISNIAVLSKVTMGESIEKSAHEITAMIKEVVDEFSTLLESTGMKVKLELPKSLPANVNPIIGEIFKNYLSNAIKYSTSGKKIVISAVEDSDFIRIDFKDFGESIPEKEHKRIFKRNIQLKRENRQGRGLGLAIVERIATMHNAKVGVMSNEPKGNIFYLKIPK